MKITRIYHPGAYHVGDTVALSPEASHHLAVVLRMHAHDAVTLFRDTSEEYTGHIHHIQSKIVHVQLTTHAHINRESPCKIHLIQGLAKGDKMDWIVQKATELGVHTITPLITQHSSVKYDEKRFEKKQRQWQSIAIHACEQSGRTHVPLINPVERFDVFLQKPPSENCWTLCPTATQRLSHLLHLTKPSEISLLIGPEGGFHPHEIEQITQKNYHQASLGPRILRTETASIVALSLLQGQWGDL